MTLPKDAKRISFVGRPITAERRDVLLPGEPEWVVTFWHQGLPIERRPIDPEKLIGAMQTHSYEITT